MAINTIYAIAISAFMHQMICANKVVLTDGFGALPIFAEKYTQSPQEV